MPIGNRSIGSGLNTVQKVVYDNKLGFHGTTEALNLDHNDKLMTLLEIFYFYFKYIIITLAIMVLGEVRKMYANTDSAGFCIKSNGTRLCTRAASKNLTRYIPYI